MSGSWEGGGGGGGGGRGGGGGGGGGGGKGGLSVTLPEIYELCGVVL